MDTHNYQIKDFGDCMQKKLFPTASRIATSDSKVQDWKLKT